LPLDLAIVRSDIHARLLTVSGLVTANQYAAGTATQFDDLPLVEIGPPSFSLPSGDDGALPELGFEEWSVDWPLVLYVSLAVVDTGQAAADVMIARLMDAFNPDNQLASAVTAAITNGEPDQQGRERATPVLAYNLTLSTTVKAAKP
jgi:hypothetical protein